MADARTVADCDVLRDKCAGGKALPASTNIIILLALFGMIVGAYLLQTSALTDTRGVAALLVTKDAVRDEQFKQLLASQQAILSALTKGVNCNK